MTYFGVIEEIWELNYVKLVVCVFKCKWVDSNIGVQTDDFGFTLVDLNKLAYQDVSFIMVEQAKQVFYDQDPCAERWSVVLHRKSLVFILKMMIQPLILVTLLSVHTCLTLMEKKLTMSMQIVMTMIKDN